MIWLLSGSGLLLPWRILPSCARTEGESVIPGRTLNICFSCCVYTLASNRTCGLGPTRDMSPFSIFQNWIISSILEALKKRPLGVIGQSMAAADEPPTLSALATKERNLIIRSVMLQAGRGAMYNGDRRSWSQISSIWDNQKRQRRSVGRAR